MTDKQFVVRLQPNVCFDADAACCEGFVEWDGSPVVIMRVAGLGNNVAAEVVPPGESPCAIAVGLFPLLYNGLQTTIYFWWVEAVYEGGNNGYVGSSKGQY